jgi:hypothetical protein
MKRASRFFSDAERELVEEAVTAPPYPAGRTP